MPDSRARLVREVSTELKEKPPKAAVSEKQLASQRARYSSAYWQGNEFEDLGIEKAALGDCYFKSECRPLITLHTWWSKRSKDNLYRGSFRTWLDARDRARKDLYWLGHDLIATPESGSGFVEHVHREMCAQFVQKNFDNLYHAKWTLDEARAHFDKLAREKEMLLLCPTGAFKSTANKVDCVQWLLNFPDVRIFIITGSGPLSRKFLKEVKGFFFKPDKTLPTPFQILFPEYVIEGEDGESLSPLYSPARVHQQPGTPSLWVNSIDGAIAGWHCDIWKGDDVVNEQNSNTDETRTSLKDKYDNISSNRPDRWAFKDHLGTRYAKTDWYGSRIEQWEKHPDTNELRYLWRSAWTVKQGFERTPIKKLEPHMVDLYFPEFMPFKLLMQKCRANEAMFRCQQLNQPAGGDILVHFEKEAIDSHTILLTGVPKHGDDLRIPICVWDTAHETHDQADYSAGAVGWCDQSAPALYVLEVAFGKWTDSQVAIEVVELHWKWNARFSELEKFHGWRLLGQEIQRISMGKYRKPLPLLWRESHDKNAKNNRIKALEVLLASDRLWFVDGDWMEKTLEQFVRFDGRNIRARKDDIPDAISNLQKLLPFEARLPDVAEETELDRKAREALELRQQFARGMVDAEYQNVFQAPPTPPTPVEAPRTTAAGPDWIFGNSGIHL